MFRRRTQATPGLICSQDSLGDTMHLCVEKRSKNITRDVGFKSALSVRFDTIVVTAATSSAPVAQKHGISMVELALSWCRGRQAVACTIIGATSMQQLKQNLAAFEVQLTPECLADVDLVFKRYKDPALID
eukprot:jgi/Ulvmu1/12038/UM083_0051.1